MKHYLVRQREAGQFTPKGADDFISQFRRTVEIAGLFKCDKISDSDDDTSDEESDDISNPGSTGGGSSSTSARREPREGLMPHSMPISGGRVVQMDVPTSLTEGDVDFMIEYLKLMKRTLPAAQAKAQDGAEDASE